VKEEDHSVLPSSQTQYRLKPTEELEPQVCSISNGMLRHTHKKVFLKLIFEQFM